MAHDRKISWLKLLNYFRPVRFFLTVLTLVLAVGVVAVFFGIYRSNQNLIIQTVKGQASSYFDLIIKAREWNAMHAGVYVVKGPGVESNPFLSGLGVEPDLRAADGRVLTLQNPALMTKEISLLTLKDGGTTFHITSLKYVNPENAPDGFERGALEQFERGVTEVWSIGGPAGKPVFRYMRPLFINEGCLNCHRAQGYRLGDIRGGISINIPFGTIQSNMDYNRNVIAALCAITLALLFITIYTMSSSLLRKLHEAQDRLKEVSITDELTGLKNRRFVMEQLRVEFEKAGRTGSRLSVLSLDIDHFKRINDTYGHPFGDHVLLTVAARLAGDLRPYDLPGRMGGEEFLVISPGVGLEGATKLAERVRQVIRSEPMGVESAMITVTVSVGVTSLLESDDAPESLVHRADRALYQAKGEGRDRVVAI